MEDYNLESLYTGTVVMNDIQEIASSWIVRKQNKLQKN